MRTDLSGHIAIATQPGSQALDLSDRDAIRALVCHTHILDGLSAGTCDKILDSGRIQKAAKDAYLFNQGDPAGTCYVVLSGEIKLIQLTPGGKRIVIDIIGPGMHLGFFVALTEKAYPISANAIEDSVLYVWDALTMRSLVSETPGLTMNTITALTDRLLCLQEKVQQLATERVEQRIAHSLLALSRHLGKREKEGLLINTPLTHRDLAEMSGTNIYSVSRVLHKWEDDKLILTGRKRIVLCDPQRLERLTRDES